MTIAWRPAFDRRLITKMLVSRTTFSMNVLGRFKDFLCLVKQLDPVQREYPDLISHVAETDQVERSAEKPHPVRVDPSHG